MEFCYDFLTNDDGELKLKETYHFGKRLRKMMDLRKLTQAEVANAADVSQSTIHRTLYGSNVPNMETMYRISQALNIPMEALSHPNDLAAEVIYELHFMEDTDLSKLLEHIRKEKLWKSRQATQA